MQSMNARGRGQTLVIFALFLTVLIGVSALAIDYAGWLLTDRKLQNISDHASLAGASVFNQNINQASCTVNPGQQLCSDARIHAWTSLSQELDLGLDAACLSAAGNTPAVGWTDASDAGCPAKSFKGHRIWVSTPPPSNGSYIQIPDGTSGRLAGNFGIVFVRVDRPAQAFLSGIFGIRPRDRLGWSTAGVLPNDFALQLFCRDRTNPAGGNSVCTSKGVGIEGGGGITLVRGDIGSNQSLQVTQQGSQGVILRDGNVFLFEGTCGPSTWNCPPATTGGISDGNGNAKNAFYIPPQPVPHWASPLDYATAITCPTTQAGWDGNPVPCVPYRPLGSTSPGDWSCSTSDPGNYCGTPVLTLETNSSIRAPHCEARVDPNAASDAHLRTYADLGNSAFHGSQFGPQDIYRNLYTPPNDPGQDPPGALNAVPNPTTLTGPPTNWVYTNDGDTTSYRAAIQPPNGLPDPGNLTVRYTLFKTVNNGAIDTANGGNAVSVTVQLQEFSGGAWVTKGPSDVHDATGEIIAYQYQVPVSAVTNYSALSLKFTVTTTKVTGPGSTVNRGAGISWAEVETTNLQPALPPMIPPGYYHSITIPADGCAILDPTGARQGLQLGQLAGVYRFGPNASSAIDLGQGALLIGDGVTLVFDRDFPDPTGGRGITMASNAALMLNTYVVGGYNPSRPLGSNSAGDPLTNDLGHDALAAAWAIDPTTTAGIYQGASMWGPTGGTGTVRGVCTDANLPGTACIQRTSYDPLVTPVTYRGITFYFTNLWPATTIRDRFQMSGSTGQEPGIAFRGVLYAPYDDVKLTGGNGFNQIGQVMSWTAKFAGQSTIYLDYPYQRCQQTNSCLPYLLEPTLNQ
jgi:hypothetical protein